MSKYKYEHQTEPEKDELYKPAKYNYETRGVFSPAPRHIFSVDLVDMTGRPMKGYKYIFNCVDVFSRKLFTRILKNKDIRTIKKTFESIFEEAGKPDKIWGDQEPAWMSHELQKYFKDNNIILYHTYGKTHASIVERLNRTMKEQIEKHVGDKWLDFVEKFVVVYNKTEHRSIKTTPNNAFSNHEGIEIAKEQNYYNYHEKRTEMKIQLNVGDRVRIQAQKDKFVKGYKQRWSDEIFTVVEVIKTNPTTYKLKDEDDEVLLGSFYKEELQKTKF